MMVDERWFAGLAMVLILAAGCTPSSTPAMPDGSVPTPTIASTIPPPEAYRPNFPEPVTALEAFLQAEVEGDFVASFQYLTASDQGAAGGPGGWTVEHFLVLPTVDGYAISGDTADAARSEVTVELDLQPDLDQLAGLTTSTANSTWVLVKEPSGWRVALTQTSIEPVYLDDRTAPAAVEQWVEQRQACLAPVQWDQALVGFPTLADPLCGAEGPIKIGEAEFLSDAAESAPFLAAFGPEVWQWGRVVAIDSPASLRAVVAPIGEQWLVIGVLEPSSS